MADRNFLYLDTAWVKQQLEQIEPPVRDQTLRENRSRDGGFAITAKLPVSGIEGSGGRRGHSEVASEWKTEDTPERMFDRYRDHLSRDGDLITAPSAPLIPGERYELRGQIVEDGVFRVREGFDVTFRLDATYWRHDDDGTDIPLVLFGLCLRGNSVRVMAIYLPERARPALPVAPGGVGRRTLLTGLAGAGVLAAAGVAGWQATRPKAPTLALYRIAGGPGEFFADPEVQDVFRTEGLSIQHTAFGSAELQFVDLSKYDGVFPASSIMARQIQGLAGNRGRFPSFGSPMVVMTHHEAVTPMLEERGIVRNDAGQRVFDVLKYLDEVREKRRWPRSDLLGDRRLLLRTTDPSTSNSAAMFIAVASHVLNGNNTVTDQETVARWLPRIKPCFADQGDMYSTSSFLRRAYFEGPGTVPIGWIYENDVVEELISGRTIECLYPKPNVLSEHFFIPVSDHPDGARIGRMLEGDPRLIEIAQVRYGFRYGTRIEGSKFEERLSKVNNKITVPSSDTLARLGLVEIPSVDILGSFIDAVQPQRKSPA